MTQRLVAALAERQLSDQTRLKRAVALLQRELGAVFGNAQAQRRNGGYDIQIAVYEKPIPGTGQAFRMPPKQARAWVKYAADRVHPRLYRRLTVDSGSWEQGRVSHKLF